jgi:hypothetical protein
VSGAGAAGTATGRGDVGTASTSVGRPVAGSDRIASPALVHTAQAVAAEALRVPLREVRARVVDDGHGGLAVEVTSPLLLPVLGSHAVPDEPVLATAHRARTTIAERLRTITGRKVARVSLTFSSAVLQAPRRVR